jgi:hypothetical protein
MTIQLSVGALRNYLGVLLVLFATFGKSFAKGENNGCTSVKLAYGAKGLNKHDVPTRMIAGKDFSLPLPGPGPFPRFPGNG